MYSGFPIPAVASRMREILMFYLANDLDSEILVLSYIPYNAHSTTTCLLTVWDLAHFQPNCRYHKLMLLKPLDVCAQAVKRSSRCF